MSLFVLFLLVTFQNILAVEDWCLIDPIASDYDTPIVLTSDWKQRPQVSFYDRRIFFQKGESFYIVCEQSSFKGWDIGKEYEKVTCVGDSIIISETSKKSLDFNTITCLPGVKGVIFNNVGGKCEKNYNLRVTGLVVHDKMFPAYSVCWEQSQSVPLYAKFRTNKGRIDNALKKNPNFSENFEVGNHRQAVEALGVVNFITDKVYLIDGRLATQEDLFYPYEKDKVSDLVNVRLRWNTIENGNWKIIQNSIRKFISNSTKLGEVTVLTGGLRVATLPNKEGVLVNLKLHNGKNPVPLWNWRLLHSHKAGVGVIFFVYNNPYVSKPVVNEEFNNTICRKNVLEQIEWVNTQIDNTSPFAGFTYACPLKLTKIIDKTMSEIVKNLLTPLGLPKKGQ
ncbi:uncharacterized protein LOC123004130 [Tribolium madens]|uniref:uncharacterized protein LOC123004130 n=1 Tax=Tribolium madens TaxID=41895 RepID=UPI001CF73F9C|nr:uncharacterized protein LOC123004130 [Tribolium madens]